MTSVTRKLGWGGVSLEASDDEVAAMWARQWEQTGSCISTFETKCFDKNMPPGEEEAWNDPGPALFVRTMHALQRNLMRVNPPAKFAEETNTIKRAKQQQQKAAKLGFFARHERRRAEGEESGEKDHSRWLHEEL
ncbi:hypothetical protein RHS04_00195 [Rhizoctonia solani]|uniref:Uncharacterized protein n=1 Tax=Rhizoctonia solani TaxID=456999 RepID=A0A8H7IAU7_9AGAM|nr:hypothetical protein RHS04_00195 [Rhizoctonia solani]KAF8754677.1 hypothetical protein RHS01_05973 [Rhizoctonia solani]